MGILISFLMKELKDARAGLESCVSKMGLLPDSAFSIPQEPSWALPIHSYRSPPKTVQTPRYLYSL